MNHRRPSPGHQYRDNGACHARSDSLSRGRGCIHPVQGEDEKRPRAQVRELADDLDHVRLASARRSLVLNSFSIRSVMRKPLTMFVIEAKSATVPSVRI